MYSDHPHMVNCFMSNRRPDGSIRAFFADFMSNHIKGNKYGKKKFIDEVFYQGDPSKNRTTLADYNTVDDESEKDYRSYLADEMQTINLINDYISMLDLRKEQNKIRLKTLFVIFMLREFRDKFYKLELKPEYAKLIKDTYYNILKAKYLIYTQAVKDLKDAASGNITEHHSISTKPDYLVENYMNSSINFSPEFMQVLNAAANEDETTVEVKTNIDDSLDELGLSIFTNRADRIMSKKIFPYLSDKKLGLMKKVLMHYRSLWQAFSPQVQANILTRVIGIPDSTYNSYKSKVSTELIKLSNTKSYDDITPYLLSED